MAKEIIYECRKCGKRVMVSNTGERHMSPVYCCGEELKTKIKGQSATKKTKTNK